MPHYNNLCQLSTFNFMDKAAKDDDAVVFPAEGVPSSLKTITAAAKIVADDVKNITGYSPSPPSSEGRMTATVIIARRDERLRRLGPVVSQMQSEFQKWVVLSLDRMTSK